MPTRFDPYGLREAPRIFRCVVCKKPFYSQARRAKYCSKACRIHVGKAPTPVLPTKT